MAEAKTDQVTILLEGPVESDFEWPSYADMSAVPVLPLDEATIRKAAQQMKEAENRLVEDARRLAFGVCEHGVLRVDWRQCLKCTGLDR